MRVATRLSVGSILAVLPLIGLLFYLLQQLDELALSIQTTDTSFQIAAHGLSLLQRLDRLEEYSSKFTVTKDLRYQERFSSTHALLTQELKTLEGLSLSATEQAATDKFRTAFNRIPTELVTAPASPGQEPPSGNGEEHAPDSGRAGGEARPTSELMRALLPELREYSHQLVGATRTNITQRSQLATVTSQKTNRLTWLITGAALCLTALVLLVTLRSIHKPLKRLSSATKQVSLGKLDLRIETRGSDELVELSQAFNQMVADLWQITHKRSRLLAQVSHDLKTPLVSMQETNRLLLDELPGPLTPDQQRLLELNSQAADRLSSMVTDLLDLARLESGVRYDMTTNDLDALVHRAVEEMEPRARELEVRIRPQLGAPILLYCDGKRILQLLGNLLDNALKFTGRGGEITLSAEFARSNQLEVKAPQSWLENLPGNPLPRYVLLAISDTGPGIAPSELERIFDDFYQGTSQNGQPKHGVGLGLSICREIVGAHGGAIWATNRAEQAGQSSGANFWVLLPCPNEQISTEHYQPQKGDA